MTASRAKEERPHEGVVLLRVGVHVIEQRAIDHLTVRCRLVSTDDLHQLLTFGELEAWMRLPTLHLVLCRPNPELSQTDEAGARRLYRCTDSAWVPGRGRTWPKKPRIRVGMSVY